MAADFSSGPTCMFVRIVALFLLLTSLSASASLLSQQGTPARYMQTTEDAVIWAQVGNDVVSVGNIRAGQIIAVVPTSADYYEFSFGFRHRLYSIKATSNRCRASSGLKTISAICINR